MVKYLLITAVTLLTACRKTPENVTSDKCYDAEQYSVDGVSRRVKQFLDGRKEINRNQYQAIFVNTEGCAACVNGMVSDIREFLRSTPTETFVFANEKSLAELLPQNPALHFICLPAREFKKRQIFHREMYLYSVNRKTIEATHLDELVSDSLNRLPAF